MEIINRQNAIKQGLKYYFTGKPCRRGHISAYHTKRHQCVSCDEERIKVLKHRANMAGSAYRLQLKQNWHKNFSRKNGLSYARHYQKTKASIEAHLIKRARDYFGFWLKGTRKLNSVTKLLGCTPKQLKAHLESLFSPGMDWSNYGFGPEKWHIDHKTPLINFNPANLEDQKKAWNFKNLQSMWQFDNLSKGRKVA